jgi:hypothetical protein
VLEHLHGRCLNPRILSRVHEHHPQQQNLQMSSASSPVCLPFPIDLKAGRKEDDQVRGNCCPTHLHSTLSCSSVVSCRLSIHASTSALSFLASIVSGSVAPLPKPARSPRVLCAVGVAVEESRTGLDELEGSRRGRSVSVMSRLEAATRERRRVMREKRWTMTRDTAWGEHGAKNKAIDMLPGAD